MAASGSGAAPVTFTDTVPPAGSGPPWSRVSSRRGAGSGEAGGLTGGVRAGDPEGEAAVRRCGYQPGERSGRGGQRQEAGEREASPRRRS
ncbi:MAG: hypothetical protein R2713_06675 [Ilumatobacteraceae bacterium]